MPWLINAAQLEKFRKNQKNVAVLDASFFLPIHQRDALAEFNQAHIQGARFMDLNLFHDTQTTLPNMLIRDERVIAERLGELGLTQDHKIIFYDNSDLHTSCRALWMMKVFGHNPFHLYILDGGLAAWQAFGGKIESGEAKPTTPKTYKVNYTAHLIRSLMQMKSNLHHPAEQVVDVRHPIRFAGGVDHYHAHVRPGHIPGSFSFPYTCFFDIDGQMRPLERIRKSLLGIGLDFSVPIVSTCGSGMTSAILNFTLDLLNVNHHALYDGSWSEWGSDKLYLGEDDLSERPVVRSVDLA